MADDSKSPKTAAAPAATPQVPDKPLLPPVPRSLIKSSAETAAAKAGPIRKPVAAFLQPTREQRNARQVAKQTREQSASLIAQMQAHETALTAAIAMAEKDAVIAAEFTREGLDMDASKKLLKALSGLLDEFAPAE